METSDDNARLIMQWTVMVIAGFRRAGSL